MEKAFAFVGSNFYSLRHKPVIGNTKSSAIFREDSMTSFTEPLAIC